MGLELPKLPTSKGIYKRCVIVGDLLYVSGHISVNTDGSLITGKVGIDVDEAHGQNAAKQAALAILHSIKLEIGDLDKIARVIKLLGMVNAAPQFGNHAWIMNGCSQLFADLWGDNGIGVRSAVGMGSLPGNVTVEIEGIFQLH